MQHVTGTGMNDRGAAVTRDVLGEIARRMGPCADTGEWVSGDPLGIKRERCPVSPEGARHDPTRAGESVTTNGPVTPVAFRDET